MVRRGGRCVVITFFLGRINRTLRAREAEIRRLGNVAARSARLASLTTLAAGAAHELGSPLGTIAVVAREIQRRAAGASDALGEDARLLRAEVERCRSILDRMAAHAERARSDASVALRAADALAALREGLAEDRSASRLRGDLRMPADASLAGEALAVTQGFGPEQAVLDLRLPDRSGVELLADLRSAHPALACIVLTGFGSIATAVEAVRRGAVDYLTKPADADEILRAFATGAGEEVEEAIAPSFHRVEWEHIQRVLSDCGGNVSRAARVLGLHRRTLQRKLATRPPAR